MLMPKIKEKPQQINKIKIRKVVVFHKIIIKNFQNAFIKRKKSSGILEFLMKKLIRVQGKE